MSFVFSKMSLRYVLEDTSGKRHLLRADTKDELVIKIRNVCNFKEDQPMLLEYFDKDFDCFVLCSLKDLPDKVRIKATPGESAAFPMASTSSTQDPPSAVTTLQVLDSDSESQSTLDVQLIDRSSSTPAAEDSK